MNLSKFFKSVVLLASAAVLTACGGGGGGGNDSGFNPPGLRISATAATASVQAGRTVDVAVRLTQANGAAVPDGTAISAIATPGNLGSVVGLGAAGPNGSNQATTVGGNANFRFTGGAVGSGNLTFSAADSTAPSRTVTATVGIQVTPGIDRLTIEATTTTLPINAFNVAPFVGSPYLAEVTITVRTASGQLVNADNGAQVSVNPVGNTGGFSTLDDATTTDVNEFTVRLGQGPVDVVAGKATVFMHSLNFSGTTVMTVTAQDPETSETVTASQTFTITSTTSRLPSEVQVSPTTAPQYVQGSGGNTSGQFEVRVNDGIGQPVPNPVSGSSAFNNVRLEIVGDASGARLVGLNAAGQSVSGTSVNVRTTTGISGGTLLSGTVVGNVLIRATSDRADNNVDNGISDPVIGQRTVAVSDGVLFDIDITQPITNALTVNPVDTGATPAPGTGVTVPVSPDGSYSLTVGAIATDRLGNPVIPGTTISFGLIDEPQATGFGDFFISGLDGDPAEGGTTFTAPGGAFTTAGGGAGPGDALVLFGENVIGQRDHESARRIASVNSRSSLTVNRRFNNNDTTGVVVNSGPVLPYIIGRAADGNITASATTNALGVVRVQMNYPVSKLGKNVIVWAQGDGDLVGGSPESVADVEFLAFAGVAPATLIVSPSTIPGNTTTNVIACVVDALGSPIGGVSVGFGFTGLGTGTGRIDGTTGAGTLASRTGFDGCVTGVVNTSGLLASGGGIDFSAAGDTAQVTIEVGTLILTANPSAFFGTGGTTTLRLVDGGGRPVSGAQLTGTCTGANGAILQTAPAAGGSGVTDANGEARFSITTENLNQVNVAGSGSCTYRTASGTPSTIVTVQGVDVCDQGFSPEPVGCTATPTTQVGLTLNLVGTVAGTGAVAQSVPAGIACTKPDAANQTCTASFVQGSSLSLLVTPQPNGPDGARRVIFTGDCVGVSVPALPTLSGETRSATVVMSAARTCTATISP